MISSVDHVCALFMTHCVVSSVKNGDVNSVLKNGIRNKNHVLIVEVEKIIKRLWTRRSRGCLI
jgi:hypothetical protein